MWNSEGFNDKVLSGWERSETSTGIPYYINHKNERTQWDHPFLVKTIEELDDMNSIRYAAYRAAMKLIFLQKRLHLDLVDISVVATAFDGYGAHSDTVIEYRELRKLVDGIFHKSRKDVPFSFDKEQASELLLNFLFNLYDAKRNGYIPVMSVKTGIAALCSARLAEKYRYFFRQLSDHSNNVNRKKLGKLLHDLMQLVDIINEGSSFGGKNAGATVENCFDMAVGGHGVSEELFIMWLLKEPQTLIWLPTMHRMAAAETVKHESKCNICKAFPIVGLRYRCLKCFNYDLCQQCFFTGRISKKHKVKHPIQEYCLATTTKQDTKAFMKTVRNNISKKHRNKQKPRYHPVDGIKSGTDEYDSAGNTDEPDQVHRVISHQAQRLAEVEVRDAPVITASKQLQTETIDHVVRERISPVPVNDENERSLIRAAERRELQDVIRHLEQENKELLVELESVHARSETSSRSSDSNYQYLREEKDRLEAKQDILESHNRQLEMQLKVLRDILRQETDIGSERNPLETVSQNIPNQRLFPNKTVNLSPPQVVPDSSSSYHPHNGNLTQPLPPPYRDSLFGTQLGIPRPENNIRSEEYRSQVGQILEAQSHLTDHLNMQHLHKPPLLQRSVDQLNTDSSLPLPPKVPNLPLHVDTTYGSLDGHLGYTHFTLPSPSQSRCFLDEEAEMDELIDKLDAAYPANFTRTILEQSGKDDLYNAANMIGDAMTEFVGQFAKPGNNESEA